jgi:hypothetical protein
MRETLSNPRIKTLWQMVWPAVISAGVALAAFITIGHTPPIRAFGLAAALMGVVLTLRRFGAVLAIIGGLALAFSPAYWSQTGGTESAAFGLIALLLGGALLTTAVFGVGKRPLLGAAAGIVLFAVLFWVLVGTPRSLRLTTFFSAWALFLMIDALLTANPRPDGPPPASLRPYHTMGLLLLLVLGVLNDPLFTLMIPAAALAMGWSRTPLPRWYWAVFIVMSGVGLVGVSQLYLNTNWWLYPAAEAQARGITVPYVMADGWRAGTRWVALIQMVIGQFTLIGAALGVIGLTRLARWYPPVGVVSMVAYGCYGVWGLVYFGSDQAVLLLPLLMIQMIWVTYAVYTFSHWLQRSLHVTTEVAWLAPVIFALLPLLLLTRIVGWV